MTDLVEGGPSFQGLPTITPKMMRAGVRAYLSWSYDEEEPENLVANIFYAMLTEGDARIIIDDREVPLLLSHTKYLGLEFSASSIVRIDHHVCYSGKKHFFWCLR